MKKVIESLEKVIKDMGLTIIERHEDSFCNVIAVKHDTKGVFTVYTTKNAIKDDDFFVFKMFRTTEHIPFSSVTDTSRSFISQYSAAVEASNKQKSIYSSTFCAEEFRFFVDCAA